MKEEILQQLIELGKAAMKGKPVRIPVEITHAIDEEFGLSEWLQREIIEIRKREYRYKGQL